jgi:tetratricopeptide (TPR) repeat protein
MRFQPVIAVWGDKFIDQMCEVCLPCVLAPNNLPAIPATERFRFVFVTRACDVARLKREPIVQRLGDLIPIEFVEFDPSAYKTAHLALSAAHRIALAMAARASAHFVLLDPDLIFSSNTLASAWRVANTGKSAIMVSGLRLTTETAMPILRGLNLSETYSSTELLEPRNLMKFAMDHFHPEVARYYFDSPHFTQWPLVNLWPVGNEGLLDRSFHLHPLVFDMRCYKPEAMSIFDYDTIDGAFAFHAFPDRSRIYVETDSDNMLVFSFSSASECIEPMKENRASIELLRQTAYMFNVNALHRSFFDHAIKLHTGDLNEKWLAVERSTAGLSKHFLAPPRSVADRINAIIDWFSAARPTSVPAIAPTDERWRIFDERWRMFHDRGIQRDAEGDHLGGATDLAEAIRIGPPNAVLHFLRGVALIHAGDHQGATSEFELSLELDSSNTSLRGLMDTYRWKAFQDRGIQRDAEGDYLGAAADFAEAIRIGPPNAALHFLRGVALVHAGDRRGATSEFGLGLKLDPGNASLRSLRDAYGPAQKRRRLGWHIDTRLKLFKMIVVDSLAQREKIKRRLLDCLRTPSARARVRWRIRQVFTLVIFGRRLPEFPDAP